MDEENEDDLSSKIKQITMFDKILTIVTRKKGEDQNGEDQDEDGDQEDGHEEKVEPTQPSQHEEDQMDTTTGHDSLPPTLKDDKKFDLFGDKPDETRCQLTKKSFETSICKVLPDTAEFPEDIFNIEGCVWCRSRDMMSTTVWDMQHG